VITPNNTLADGIKFVPESTGAFVFDTGADHVTRNCERNDSTLTKQSACVQCADKSVSKSSAVYAPATGEAVWTQDGSQLLPGHKTCIDQLEGGGGFTSIDSPSGTVLAQVSPAVSEELVQILRDTGKNLVEVDVSSGTPMIASSDADVIRTELIKGHTHKVCGALFGSGATVHARRLLCTSEQLMLRSAHELDILFKGDPALFRKVDLFKSLFRLKASQLYRVYKMCQSPWQFLSHVETLIASKSKSPTTNLNQINNNDLSVTSTISPSSISQTDSLTVTCNQTVFGECKSCKQHCGFGIDSRTGKCFWCLSQNTPAPVGKSVCTKCNTAQSFEANGFNHCVNCATSTPLPYRDWVDEVQDAIAPTAVGSETQPDDTAAKSSRTVSFGTVEEILIECQDDDNESNDDSDHDSSTEVEIDDDPHDSVDVSALHTLLGAVDDNDLISLQGAQFVQAFGRRALCDAVRIHARQVRTRTRQKVEWDSSSAHLNNEERHALAHWPHDSKCVCCKHGRQTMSSTVSGGASKPDPSGEIKYLTMDYCGPWERASNGHNMVAVIAWYRPNQSTPLLFTQSMSSVGNGASAVALHAARCFWGIQHSPFQLHADNASVLNDQYLQRYAALAMLPADRLNIHAREAKVMAQSQPLAETLSQEQGEPCHISSIEAEVLDKCFIDDDDELTFHCVPGARMVPEDTVVVKACAGKIRPAGRPPANSYWDEDKQMLVFVPASDDDIIKRRRGRPNKDAEFNERVGYMYPIDPKKHHKTDATYGWIRNSLPYRSNSNARAERSIRSAVEIVRATLSSSGMPAKWWHLACAALPVLSLTALNATLEPEDRIQPGAYVGPVVPLGSMAQVKLPQKLRAKSKASSSLLSNCIVAGYNHRSPLAVKLLYLSKDKNGKSCLRSTYSNVKDCTFFPSVYPFSRTLENLEDISLISKSVLMSMRLELPHHKSKRRTNQTLAKCAHCQKWRFTGIDKLTNTLTSDKEFKCADCTAPQEKSVYDHFAKEGFDKQWVSGPDKFQVPYLVDDPIDEPTTIERGEDEWIQVKRLVVEPAIRTLISEIKSTNTEVDNLLPIETDKIVSQLTDAAVKSDCTVDDLVNTSNGFDPEKFDVKALIVNPDLNENQTSVFTKLGSHESKRISARSLIVKNRDVFDDKTSEYHDWVTALDKELGALLANGVLKAVPISDVDESKHHIIPSMLVSTIKTLDNRKKCRLVACGNFIDYANTGDIFSSVAPSYDTMALMLWSLSDPDYDWMSVDIATAFLQSEPQSNTDGSNEREDVYLRPPAVCAKNSKGPLQSVDCLWQVLASIYGLRTAPKDWALTLQSKLVELGFECTKIDDSILVNIENEEGHKCVVACYVDDLNVFGHGVQVKAVMDAICDRFKTSGDPISVKNSTSEEEGLLYLSKRYWIHDSMLHMSMESYIEEMLVRHEMDQVKDYKALQPSWFESDFLTKGAPLDKERHRKFRGGCAALGYLCQHLRLDCLVATNILQGMQANPTQNCWDTLVKVFGYVKFTKNRIFKVPIGKPWKSVGVTTLSDASFGNDLARGGHIVCLTINDDEILLPLLWKSSRHKRITLSTCEAELCELSLAAKNSLSVARMIQEWLPSSCEFRGIHIRGDNKASLSIGSGASGLRKVRHLILSDLLIRQICNSPSRWGIPKCHVSYINTSDNASDLLTKILPEDQLRELLQSIHMV